MLLLTQIGSVQVFEFATLAHVTVGAFAIVEQRVGYFDGEAGGSVETVPGRVGGRTGVRLERDVGSDGTFTRRSRLRRRSGRTSGCKKDEHLVNLSRNYRFQGVVQLIPDHLTRTRTFLPSPSAL